MTNFPVSINTIVISMSRMLRVVLNIPWQSYPSKKVLYGYLPPISLKIRDRRLHFCGHCYRSQNELISNVLLWQPRHGSNPIGRPRKTFISQLVDDTGCTIDELPTAMNDRDEWRKRIKRIREISSTR